MNEDQTTPETTTPAATPRQRPKATVRSVEQLDSISTKTMSDSEMRKYIEFLRDQNLSKDTTINNLTASCDSAFNKAKYMEDQLTKTNAKFNSMLAFIKQAVGTCYSSIILAADNV